MTVTPLVAMTLAACGTITLLILIRALRDVWIGQDDQKREVEG